MLHNAHACTQTHTHLRTHAHSTHTLTHAHTYTYMSHIQRTHTHTHTYIHVNTHTPVLWLWMKGTTSCTHYEPLSGITQSRTEKKISETFASEEECVSVPYHSVLGPVHSNKWQDLSGNVRSGDGSINVSYDNLVMVLP